MFEFNDVATPRRGFLGTLAAATAAGFASLTPLRLEAKPRAMTNKAIDPSFETWLNRITGKHKMVFDAPEVNGGMPVVWPRVWLNSYNENYGTKDADNSGVVILRHAAIPLAMKDELWAKYKLGEVVALTIYSGAVAQKMGMDPAAVKAEWVAGLIPGAQVVPSGVLAVSRAQEKGCGYCFAG